MRLSEAFVLLTAGTLGGLLSTVVSIASLVSYPVLLALGVPPLTANMTNTVSLVLTGPGSVASSRPELNGQGARVIRLTAVTALGGVTGAAVLLLAPASSFTAVAPVLIGGASVVLFVQPRMTALVPRPGTADAADPAHGAGGLAHLVALFLVAVYVGYFGAAAGVLLLVVLSSMIAEPLVKVNAIKNALNGTANFMAAICFAIFGSVRWLFVAPLAAGFLIGGWFGPKIARRVPAGALRAVVSLCGIGLAVKLGISAYR
ncbi:MAG TPA: sulfite exporter TauE/SafE family protein [Streptosporangiaceae bacterium]|nr:sulfite exporter TauE/SafE family protein [Streptosporangiaceae bacterium]